jgi:hypothetical protein
MKKRADFRPFFYDMLTNYSTVAAAVMLKPPST